MGAMGGLYLAIITYINVARFLGALRMSLHATHVDFGIHGWAFLTGMCWSTGDRNEPSSS